MALTKARVREILSKAGIATENMREAVDAIIDGHVATVNALKEEADQNKDAAQKLEQVSKKYAELQTQVSAEAKDREGKDYDRLLKEFEDYKREQETKAQREAVEKAYTAFLKDMNVTDAGIAKILKYASEGVELDEDGKIKNTRELRKSIKEEWPEFIAKTETVGADTATPPAGNANSGKTRSEILSIKDDAEMVRAIEANPGAFGMA